MVLPVCRRLNGSSRAAPALVAVPSPAALACGPPESNATSPGPPPAGEEEAVGEGGGSRRPPVLAALVRWLGGGACVGEAQQGREEGDREKEVPTITALIASPALIGHSNQVQQAQQAKQAMHAPPHNSLHLPTCTPVVLCAEGAVAISGSAEASGAAGAAASPLRSCTSVCCSGSPCSERIQKGEVQSSGVWSCWQNREGAASGAACRVVPAGL